MPSYNGVVTVSCIHTLAKLAIRFSHALPTVSYRTFTFWHAQVEKSYVLDVASFCSSGSMGISTSDRSRFLLVQERVKQLLKPFKEQKVQWQVRVAALKALLDIEFHSKGLEAAVILALQQVHDDLSFAGEVFPHKALYTLVQDTS